MKEEDYSRFMPGNNSGKDDAGLPSDESSPIQHKEDNTSQFSGSGIDNLPSDTLPYFREKASHNSTDDTPNTPAQEHGEISVGMTGGMRNSRKSRENKSGRKFPLWLTIGGLTVALVFLLIGLIVGSRKGVSDMFRSQESKDKEQIAGVLAEKFAPALYTVYSEYVDELPLDTLIDKALRGMMESLDPHSMYISASGLQKVNEELEGEFSGVGVSFIVYNDSVAVVDVIKGGPAESVGLQRGDRIVSANGVKLFGQGMTSDSVYKTLRGKEGSEVLLDIYRPEAGKNLNLKLRRGAVPVNSVDAYYILPDGNTGYVKISSFSANTYSETLNALNKLKANGAGDFVLDLRGNPGGFMDQAILIANEFLSAGREIVYTEARKKSNEMNVKADGTGAFQDSKVAVVIDENSASASEILAGAIQDNDRGVIVGRRSFGKGLVQNQYDNPAGGALRLTVARYFTPSGRSIQKEYTLGNHDLYSEDLISRYTRGELFNVDSIKLDKSKLFKTVGGRSVYGGGGIMPDIFVPEDTSSYTPYYVKAMNNGHIMNFAFKIADSYRPLLKNVRTEEQLFRIIPADNKLLAAFVDYAEEKGLPPAWFYINQSADMIVNKIKAFIARDILSDNVFYKMYNLNDNTLKKAVEALDQKLPAEPQKR